VKLSEPSFAIARNRESQYGEAVDMDKQIGYNLQQFRGDLTQQELADRMKDKGWKWSQSTVWAIEKGERPLRLAEALDLDEVFGFPISKILGSPERDASGWVAAVQRLRSDFESARSDLDALARKIAVIRARVHSLGSSTVIFDGEPGVAAAGGAAQAALDEISDFDFARALVSGVRHHEQQNGSHGEHPEAP
jgi:transcriptional regulator with XRE-family HTH domain